MAGYEIKYNASALLVLMCKKKEERRRKSFGIKWMKSKRKQGFGIFGKSIMIVFSVNQ